MALAFGETTCSEKTGTCIRIIEEVLHPLLPSGTSKRSPSELAFVLSLE